MTLFVKNKKIYIFYKNNKNTLELFFCGMNMLLICVMSVCLLLLLLLNIPLSTPSPHALLHHISQINILFPSITSPAQLPTHQILPQTNHIWYLKYINAHLHGAICPKTLMLLSPFALSRPLPTLRKLSHLT